jgi:hypothetical protein
MVVTPVLERDLEREAFVSEMKALYMLKGKEKY